MSPRFLIYGANGYTGALVAREAARRGLSPVLAGRDESKVAPLAEELNFEHRAFGLDDAARLDAGLAGVAAVLHCAGPFSRTSRPMADACLRARAHYLDITGEIAVFESLAARDREARDAGVMLLPGVGFDVVPSDCLAAHLRRRLPTATRLKLAIGGAGRLSRGTLTTMVENVHRGGMIRRGGRLTPVPAGWKTREVDFGRGPVKATTIPWGDVSTAFHSTGIPDVEVYAAAPAAARIFMKASRPFKGLLASATVQAFLKRRIQKLPPGPSEEELRGGASFVWGEVEDDSGARRASRLRGPESYALTVRTGLAAVARVLEGDHAPGFQTPSRAYGPDFVLGIEGVAREDLY